MVVGTQLEVAAVEVVAELAGDVVAAELLEVVGTITLVVEAGVLIVELIVIAVLAGLLEVVGTVTLVVEVGVLIVELVVIAVLEELPAPLSVDVLSWLVEHLPVRSPKPMAVRRQERMFKGSETACCRH